MIDVAGRERAPRPSWRERKAAAAAARDALPEEELPPKLGHSLRELLSTAGSIVHTRIALAGIELEEEIQRIINAAVMGVVAIVAGLMALVVGTFTIVLAVPPEYRVATMIAITLVYLLVVLVLGLRIRNLFHGRPPIFGATLAELEKDKETLTRMARARFGDAAAMRDEVVHEAGPASTSRPSAGVDHTTGAA